MGNTTANGNFEQKVKDSIPSKDEVVRGVNSTMEQAQEFLSDNARKVTEASREALNTTERSIKKNPLMAMGIAFGVGIALSAWAMRAFSRSREHG
ncbi:DUF883 family protein [bacterium]|nr:DUF883 family protein [bacterium]